MPVSPKPHLPPPHSTLLMPGGCRGSGIFPLSLDSSRMGIAKCFSIIRLPFPQLFGKRKQDFLGAFYVYACWWLRVNGILCALSGNYEIKEAWGCSPHCCFSSPEVLGNQPSYFTFQRLPMFVVLYPRWLFLLF